MNNKTISRSRAAAAALTILTVIFILSASVAVPLLWRGFFYLHVRMLHMTEYLPWTYEEICGAFNEMMDYCIFGGEFSTGVLRWSEEGLRHFADCRVLFRLDLILFAVSGAVLAAVFITVFFGIQKCGCRDTASTKGRKGVLGQCGRSPSDSEMHGQCDRNSSESGTTGQFSVLASVLTTGPLDRGPFFWAGIIPSAFFIALGLIIWAAGFDRAFIVFHKLFFPGKDNWIFDPAADEIINVLPELFFLDCAVLIAVFILLWSVVFIAADIKLCRRLKG